jgi:hypothetical protein
VFKPAHLAATPRDKDACSYIMKILIGLDLPFHDIQ